MGRIFVQTCSHTQLKKEIGQNIFLDVLSDFFLTDTRCFIFDCYSISARNGRLPLNTSRITLHAAPSSRASFRKPARFTAISD